MARRERVRRYVEERDAQNRIKARHERQWRPVMSELNAVDAVVTGLNSDEKTQKLLEVPAVTNEDVEDALLLIAEAREDSERHVNYAELSLIEAARARGYGWDQVGVLLGYAEPGAARSAQNRHKTLLAKFPSHGLDLDSSMGSGTDAEVGRR